MRTFAVEGLHFGINICFDTNFADAALGVAQQGGHWSFVLPAT